MDEEWNWKMQLVAPIIRQTRIIPNNIAMPAVMAHAAMRDGTPHA
jgi:hypothetical protein